MSPEPPALEDLVHAICEGTPVDWEALERIGSDSFRSQIAALRVVAGIAEVHRPPSRAPSAEPPGAPVPRRWGHLDVLEHIASGAFGDVYRAWDPQLDREVALKLLRRASDADAHADEVVEEGRLLARLRHPHIVSIYGAARVAGQVGLWMEFLRGQTLAQAVGLAGALPARRVAEIGAALCDALTAVHDAGLVHRDVKAQNVMLADDGRVVLMDFGAGRELRHIGLDMAGTPLYLAPEVARGAPATPQSDIFSLGVLMRYAATGAYSRDVEPGTHDTTLRRLLGPIETATARDPRDRYASAGACGRTLRDLLAPGRVSPALAIVAAALVMALGAVAWSLWAHTGATRSAARRDAPEAVALRLTLRPLWNRRPDGLGFMGKPSIDGRLLPLHDEEMRLVMANIDLEDPRPPVPIGLASNGLQACAWEALSLSPTAEEAVFSCVLPDGGHEVRIVTVDPARPVERRLVAEQWNPLEWSHPAVILAERPTAPRQLALIDAATGAVRPLVSLPASVDGASLSPDGQWVVFDGPGRSVSDRHDVFMVSAHGGERLPVAAGAHDDLLPAWTPRGDGVLFISDRTGSPGLWLQPVVRGIVSGPPQLLSQDLGRVMGIWAATPTGELIYFRQTGLVRTMTIALDGNARPVGEPVPIPTRQVGGTMMANWAPDSRRLAYQTTLTGSRSFALGILDVARASERFVSVPMRWFGNPRWSPDGRRVAVRGSDIADREGVHLIDVVTGDVSPLRLSGTGADAIQAFQMGHDNDVVVRMPRGFFRIDLTSRVEEPVFLFDGETDAFAVSPTDGSLAFVHAVEGEGILTVRSPAGAVRQLLRLGPREGFGEVKWAAGGRSVFFVRQPFSTRREERVPSLWRIDVTGGEPEFLGLRLDGLRDLSLSPDGRYLAFTTGWPSREPWILENYLPPAFAAR